MPVLNGELFLPQALDSLLMQDYKNFEIVILDNMSTDCTADICKRYSAKDDRVRYILDDTNRITHDANNYLATCIRGEFTMYTCDDDLWEPDFLSKHVNYLKANPEVGLVFSNGTYVDIYGKKSLRRLLRGRQKYQKDYSRFLNLWHYLGNRRVVPLIFCVYRTEVLKKALPFDTFDETIADVDNLFVLKLMTMTKIHCIDEVLFYYRSKYRGLEPENLSKLKNTKWLSILWYQARHQLNFTKKIIELLSNSNISYLQKNALKLRTVYTLIYFIIAPQIKEVIKKLLRRMGWLNDNISIAPDVHHEIRTKAHKKIDFEKLSSDKEKMRKTETVDINIE